MLLLLTASYSAKVLGFAGKKSGFMGIPRGLLALQYIFFSPKPVFSLLRLALGSTAIKQISSALVPASDTCSFCVRGTAATVTAAGDRRAREEAEQEQVKHARCCGHRVPSSPLNYGTEVAT